MLKFLDPISDDSDEEETIGPLPPSKAEKDKEEEDEDDGLIGPLPPSHTSKDEEKDEEDEDDEEGEDVSAVSPLFVPASHRIQLQHGSKPVSALAFDSSGARLATGGLDFQVSATLRKFRYSSFANIALASAYYFITKEK